MAGAEDPLASLITRADGRVEWVCEHGTGHTVDAPLELRVLWGDGWDVHGCDGCCGKRKIARAE